MTTAYTPILKLALPVTGELNGTWGDVVNDNITSMVEQAVAGLATINTWTANSHTLTTADGTTSESRCAMLVIDDDGAGNPSAAATVICPTATKAYIVQNLCGQTVTVKTAAGTGVAIPNNQAALVFCDGTNVVTGAFNGDVVGPASATDNAIARYDGATGKLIQSSTVTISDSGSIITPDIGSVQIGTGAEPSSSLVISRPMTGNVVVWNTYTTSSVQSDVTSQARMYVSSPTTQATTFTLPTLVGFSAQQQVFGAGSTVTNQYGFEASSSLTGATNNFGFRSNIAAGTGRWNFYANGTADNFFGGATTISVNSSSDALRITQTGAGNALLVEDSANPDATPVVIDSGGNVIVGASTSYPTSGSAPVFQMHSASGSFAQLGATSWASGTDTGASVSFCRSDSGAIGTHTLVGAADVLGNLTFSGSDGTNFIQTLNSAILKHTHGYDRTTRSRDI